MASIASRILPALLIIGALNPALGQENSQASRPGISQSSGLKATIGTKSILKQGATQGIALQLILENVTNKRIYLFITGDHQAALSDGQSLMLSDVIGLTYCKSFLPQERATKFCLDQHGGDLNYYSYIDPQEKVDLSLRYSPERRMPGEYTPSGSLSFRLIMVSRIATALPESLEAQANPDSITPPRLIILNFPLTVLRDGG